MDLIRGFVAVGRRMSITLAAEDLCLTQSAVSRQVNSLEKMLGVKLLERRHRSISFTPDGERLFRAANGAVQQLQDIIGTIGSNALRRSVTVTASIGFSGLWLLPRLGGFQAHHPGIDVRIAANNRLVDLKSEGVDLAVRYCAQPEAPKSAVRLFGEAIVPVAHPALSLETLDSAEAFNGRFLLDFDDSRHPFLQWREWLSAMGWSHAQPKGILRFNQYDQVIHSAIAGQGVALGRLELIRPMLADGRLAALSVPKAETPNDYAYWLIQAESRPRGEVLNVVNWIAAEVAQMKNVMTDMAAPA
jgi:DNA-binding transcriptional LysR family regulator